jgi:two-component system, cell cycle sensor histidine kinase and response regulator CckA
MTEDKTQARDFEIPDHLEAMRNSAECFRAVADYTVDWESWFGPDGTYLWVNPAVERFTGYTAEEVLAMQDFISVLVEEEDRASVLDVFHGLIQGGRGDDFEFRCRHRNGSTFWLSVSWQPIFDAKGNSLGVRTSGRDISDRKRMEQSLRESEERFRRMLQSVPTVAVQGYEMDGTTRYWNTASERIYGYTEQEALGRDLRELIIPPEMREGVGEAIRQMAATGEPIPSAELTLMRKDGSRVSVISSHAVVQIPGRPPELFCIDVEISERKAVEDALLFLLKCGQPKAGEDFFSSLARYLAEILHMEHVSIDRLGEDGLTAEPLAVFHDGVSGSSGPHGLKGTPRGETVGKAICCFPRDVCSLFPGIGALRELAAESYVGTTLWSSQGRPIGLIAVIGRRALVDSRLVETLLKLVATPASAELERRETERERHKLEERMNQVQRLEALGFLAAGTSHNMNNVLAAILGLASARETVATDEKDRDAFRVICKACERGRGVLDSLLHFARPQLTTCAPVNVNSVLGDLRYILEHTTRMRISVIEQFSEEPVWILGDVGSISHALMNLCINAVNAMPEGGLLTLRTAARGDDWVEVSVEDEGEGMAPEVLMHALEPFYTTKPEGEGTGLGLSMTYGVVKAHGGTLDISSHPGQGTLIQIRLPRIPAPVQAEPPSEAAQPAGPLQILLVDDDELVRVSTVEMLETAGCRATPVRGGQEALDSLASGAVPDIVLLDLNMPGMDGTETLQRLRALYPELPVLIVSGQPGIEERACFKQPHLGVVPKPFTMKELLSKIAQFTAGG